MKTKTYLSIDLDYWDGKPGRTRMSCTRFIRRALNLDVPVLVVLEHDGLLHDADLSGCNKIEHVDYHSDVIGNPFKPGEELCPDEGNWLSFIKWRGHGELIWRMPTVKCYDNAWGICHGDGTDPFVKPVSGWQTLKKMVGLEAIAWHEVARVGIAISTEYWPSEKPLGKIYSSVLPKLLKVKTFEQALKKIHTAYRHSRPLKLQIAA